MSKFKPFELYPIMSVRYEEVQTRLSIVDFPEPYDAAKALEQVDSESDEILNRISYIEPGHEWSTFIGNVGFDCSRLPSDRRPKVCFFTLNKKRWCAVYYTTKNGQLRLVGYTCLGDAGDEDDKA